MIDPPTPPNEHKRVTTLHNLHILDTPPEERFDRVTRLALQLFDVPIALVSLVDANRQWFKSCQGLGVQATPRAVSFCAHALLQNEMLIIENAAADPRFYDNPLVTNPPHVRFYAGQPLVHPNGSVLGTLCIIDRKPRRLSEREKQALRDLAAIVENELNSVEIAKNIIERERAEAEVYFQANLLDVVQQSVIATDVNNKIIYWNYFAEKLYGWTKIEAVGQNILDILPQQDGREEGARQIAAQFTSTESVQNEYLMRHRDGRIFPIEATSTPIFDKSNKLIGIVGISCDITQRKQSEQKLLESEQRFRTLIENSADMITVIGTNGSVLYQSPAVERIMGYAPSDWAGGKNSLAAVHPDDQPTLLKSFRELEQQQGAIKQVTFRFRNNFNGNWHYIEATLQNLLDLPAVQGIIVNARDVTDRYISEAELHKREAELRQAQKMEAVGRLAGGIAHDFNNLLTAILGYSDLVMLALDERDSLREDVAEIRMAADRAAVLTRQLLAFSRKQVLQPKLLDLNEVLEDMRKLLLRLIGEDIQLLTLKSSSPLIVEADPGQLEQVIVNLAVNARDAIPNGGQLKLSLSNTVLTTEYAEQDPEVKSGNYAVLSVTDNGYGMSNEVKNRLFEPFFTTKEPGRGTGLGLSTVYGIVKQSGGHIEVQSQLGAGTTFNIYLPLVSSSQSAKNVKVERANATEPLVAGTETILVVEDEDGLRNLVSKALSHYGFRVLEAANAGEALLLFEESQKVDRIDILLTDVILPRMSGRGLVERLKSLEPSLKILYISGYNDQILHSENMISGDSEFLQKPFTPQQLVRKVRQVLDNNPNEIFLN